MRNADELQYRHERVLALGMRNQNCVIKRATIQQNSCQRICFVLLITGRLNSLISASQYNEGRYKESIAGLGYSKVEQWLGMCNLWRYILHRGIIFRITFQSWHLAGFQRQILQQGVSSNSVTGLPIV
jgi:hypothetical protein